MKVSLLNQIDLLSSKHKLGAVDFLSSFVLRQMALFPMNHQRLHIIIASALGIGYIPKGSGTFGAILACLGVIGLNALFPTNALGYQAVLVGLTIIFLFIGRKASEVTEQIWGEDSSKIVIDEVVGQWLSLCLIPFSWTNLVLGLVLFRIYDIFKPFNIRSFEKYENGWGVMLDDVAAGIWANLTLQVLLLLFNFYV